MKAIRKKILPEYFEAVQDRKKNFEIRKDDYNQYVKQVTPVYPLWRNMLRAF